MKLENSVKEKANVAADTGPQIIFVQGGIDTSKEEEFMKVYNMFEKNRPMKIAILQGPKGMFSVTWYHPHMPDTFHVNDVKTVLVS